jgi:fibro-slime domain-containing protein
MKLLKAIFIAISAFTAAIWAENKTDSIFNFYVFLPKNQYWLQAVPIINEDGKDRVLEIDPENCGWYYRRYVNEKLPSKVFIHADNDETMAHAIGFGGEKETDAGKAPEEIDLKILFDIYKNALNSKNALYFVADEKTASSLQGIDFGWYTTDPGIIGDCQYILTSVIYDTDASLHGAFSCGPNWNGALTKAQSHTNACFYPNVKYPVITSDSAEMPCMGVTQGMVESTLDSASKKMKLTDIGRKCFGPQADEAFAAMFNQTDGVNEASCYDMRVSKSLDHKWTFSSDFIYANGLKTPVLGGFFPVEYSDEDVITFNPNQKQLPEARTKRKAEGPIFYGPELRKLDSIEHTPIFNLFCNGPGWDKGFNCNELFDDGYETELAIRDSLKLGQHDCIFGWSCDFQNAAPEGMPVYAVGTEKPSSPAQGAAASYRWTSEVDGDGNGGRNHHFCSETHARFIYKKNATFSISGNDDIWVFIDNKLAVDLGGTHLAAPAYVDLNKFLPQAIEGNEYDIDIFTCDRRTTTSNLNINTNLFIYQKDAFDIQYENTLWDMSDSKHHFKICHTIAKDNCGKPISFSCDDPKPYRDRTITYQLTTDSTGTDSTKTIISEAEFAATPIQLNGAINVSEPNRPVIDQNKVLDNLTEGSYYLIVKINSDQMILASFTIKSEAAIAERSIKTNSKSFHVLKSGALEITIVTDKSSKAKQYAIMDMKGQVISAGTLNNSTTRAKVPTAGSYIVKVGKSYKRVNVK